jgi:D-alanyl-lipoteichoic acid acyltransferase DltB (MBOAT superfamily)
MFRFKLSAIFLLATSPLFAELTKQNSISVLKITFFGFFIVLLALTAVYLFVMAVSASVIKISLLRQKQIDNKKRVAREKQQADQKGTGIPDETAVAIMSALYLYQKKIMDEEKTKLTFERWAKPYSPWSSKIYGLRQPLIISKRAGK